jgi:hypothetical protein
MMSMVSSKARASAGPSTGVLPPFTMCCGPRTEAAGLRNEPEGEVERNVGDQEDGARCWIASSVWSPGVIVKPLTIEMDDDISGIRIGPAQFLCEVTDTSISHPGIV